MNTGELREKAERLKEPENFKQTLKDNWTIPSVGFLFLLSFYIRSIPAKGMELLGSLDPYMIFRMSQHLALSGNMPALDFARYFPYSTPTYVLQPGDIAIPAILYNLGLSGLFPSYLQFAQIYPAIMGATGIVLTYYLGKEIFDEFTGVSAAFFLAVLSGVLQRTSAGFFEKEPTGTVFMLMSMIFFTRAWKREEWKYGILSGLSLGVFTISWGGSKMLWLLYPLVTGAVLFFDEDIRSLIASYTPTIIIGGLFAAAFNPARFSLTGEFFLPNLALIALLWSRYLVEQYEVVSEEWLKYYVPSLTGLGGVMLLLSPLYSQFIAQRFIEVIKAVTEGKGGSVILGTVSESQAASLGSMVTSLGINTSRALTGLNDWFISTFGMQELVNGLGVVLVPLSNLFAFIANFVNPWTFMLLGTPVLGTKIALMLGEKYDLVSDISGKTYYSYIQATAISWVLALTGFFLATPLENPSLRVYSLIAGAVALAALYTVVYYLEEEAFNILLMVFGFLLIGEIMVALSVVGASNVPLIAYALLRSAWAKGFIFPVLAGFAVFLAAYVSEDFRAPEIDFSWYYILPFFWLISNVLAAISSSRLVFLAAFPVTFIAGYAFAMTFRRVRDMEVTDLFPEAGEITQNIGKGTVIVFVTVMLFMNFFAALGTANLQQQRQSPGTGWEPALDYMKNETPEGSVVMSWWDYGYWFETIGRRAAIADGGNLGYYSDSGPVNYPLADYLTSSMDEEERKDFLRKHSVDYIALDRSMIGKYSAVSQISRRSNDNYTAMRSFTTPEPISRYVNLPEDRRVLQFRADRGNMLALAPFDIVGTAGNQSLGNLSIEINEPVTIRAGASTRKINCKLTDQGVKKLGNTSERRTIPFCVAERPAPDFELAAGLQRPAGLVMVPKEITDSMLVRLYLMDGYGIDYVEKLDISRYEYAKMWKVQDLQ